MTSFSFINIFIIIINCVFLLMYIIQKYVLHKINLNLEASVITVEF